MPQIRYYTVDVHLQAKVSGTSGDDGGELTHADAVKQVLSRLRTDEQSLEIGHINVNVTETSISDASPKRKEEGS